MSSVKLLQFRLDFDRTYDSRWTSLNDAIATIAPNRWSEATASFLFHHPNKVEELLEAILSKTTLYRDGRDMLMILDIATSRVAQIGVKDPTLLRNVLLTGNIFSHVA